MKRHGHLKDAVNRRIGVIEKKQAVDEFMEGIGIIMIMF